MSGNGIRVLRARKIVTMDRARPAATHVAVREGRILAVGGEDDVAGWCGGDSGSSGDGSGERAVAVDDTYADKVLTPGFVEGHCHAMEGAVWSHPYAGYFERRAPDGKRWPGLDSIDAVVERLQRAEAALDDPAAPLFAWGFDPIYFGDRRMTAADLDRVSTARPVLVVHASGHLLNVNGLVLQRAGIARDTDVHGIAKDERGEPTGELQEMAAMHMAYRVAGGQFFAGPLAPEDLRRFGRSANLAGVTTATDLHSRFDDETVATYRSVTAEDDFPIRLVPAYAGISRPTAEGIALVEGLRGTSTAKLHLGLVKLMTDGSIQGFTGRLRWPGYYNGAPNGVWNLEPSELARQVEEFHAAGCHLHVHTNGDEAIELMIDAFERALARHPRPDHRHTLQHCQMADAAQFRRMKALGLCCNLFANHIYYWGLEHYRITMGPDRAWRMDACAGARDAGVPFAIHSDAPITPLAPLFTAWCAVNRTTREGWVLGPEERIGVGEALRAITLGAAYTLKLDHLVGSVEVGKYADFAVLDEDPEAVAPEALKDVPVAGTVLGGRDFPAAGAV